MKNENIIIEIIKENMRLHQQVTALGKPGIVSDDLHPQFIPIIARLMQVENYADAWVEVYMEKLYQCESLSVEPLGNNLYTLAEVCYQELLDCGTMWGRD